jgi:hypothetical protein
MLKNSTPTFPHGESSPEISERELMKRLAEEACIRQPEMVPTACLSRLEVHNLGQMPQPPVQTEEFRNVEKCMKTVCRCYNSTEIKAKFSCKCRG